MNQEHEAFIQSIPKSRVRQNTFLEIIKAAHRETIVANLLAFYFQPKADHQLGDLFIRALLQTKCYLLNEHRQCELPAGVQKLIDNPITWAKVTTEDSTVERKRLDIVIETDKLIIAIEFKINHNLNNPLNTYISHIESNLPKDKPKYFVVLTPVWKEPSGEANTEFRQVLLSHFIDQVEALKAQDEQYAMDSSNPQYHFYRDFITTIRNRKIEIDMLKEYRKFVSDDDNFEKLNAVYSDLQTIKKNLDAKMADLLSKLPDFNLIESSREKFFSVIEKKHKDGSLKVRLTLKGWSLENWKNNSKTSEETLEFDAAQSIIVSRINQNPL